MSDYKQLFELRTEDYMEVCKECDQLTNQLLWRKCDGTLPPDDVEWVEKFYDDPNYSVRKERLHAFKKQKKWNKVLFAPTENSYTSYWRPFTPPEESK